MEILPVRNIELYAENVAQWRQRENIFSDLNNRKIL